MTLDFRKHAVKFSHFTLETVIRSAMQLNLFCEQVVASRTGIFSAQWQNYRIFEHGHATATLPRQFS